MLRRLGVFAGPFALDAAEAVVSSPGDLDPIGVFDTVSRLVDKSLVIAEDSDSQTRYRLLETIRAFAINRARDPGELQGLRDAHATWWRDRLEGLRVTGPTDDVVALIDTNHDDLVAALSWAAERDPGLGLQLLRPLARGFQGTGHAGDAMHAIDLLLGPAIEHDHPRLWLRAATTASIPLLVIRGHQAFAALLVRCEARAVALDEPYLLALSRWLMEMTVETDRELLRRAREGNEPYAAAMAAVRLAIDTVLDEPDTARLALRDARTAAASYGSQYVREFAVAAGGRQELVFGELSLAVTSGFELIASRAWPMREQAYWLLLTGGLLSRDEAAVEAALETACRAAARRIPRADDLVKLATALLAQLRDESSSDRSAMFPDAEPGLASRQAVDLGDMSSARASAEALASGGTTKQAILHAINGLIDTDENQWHEALRLASDHGLRLIAVDALEALGAAAAATDSSREALRLLGAADRLREETGYRWRFRVEQEAYDAALAAGRTDLGDAADQAWLEGRELEWHDAVTYARRARGERGRPRHGWSSLTPTEQHVAELVAVGLTNPQIAERLLMGRGTVKTHLEHVFSKTGRRNRAELAAEVVRQRQTATDQERSGHVVP